MSEEIPEVRYQRLRPHQIIAIRDRMPIAYVPVGPLEWHGPHLPMGTDVIRPQFAAIEAAKISGGVALPVIPLGTETYMDSDKLQYRGFKGDERVIGMDFPAFPLPSLYIDDCVLGLVLHEVVRGLKRQQFKTIVLVNGHGGPNHIATLNRVAMEETEPGKVAVVVARVANSGFLPRGGHAERYEVGAVMAIDRETVDLSMLPPKTARIYSQEYGVLDGPQCRGNPLPDYSIRDEQDPRDATVEEGREDLDFAAHRIAKAAQEALATVS